MKNSLSLREKVPRVDHRTMACIYSFKNLKKWDNVFVHQDQENRATN